MSNNKAIVIIMICYFIFMLLMLKFEDNKTKPEASIHNLTFQSYSLPTKGFECTNSISLGFTQFPSKECSLRGRYE